MMLSVTDEVEFEDDDDDDEPVSQPKTIPKQTTVPKTKNNIAVTKPVVSKARDSKTSKSSGGKQCSL